MYPIAIQLGGIMAVTPSPAALAFAGVAVATMLSAMAFDPRLSRRHPERSSRPPGTRLILRSAIANSLSPGDAVNYRGYRVGRVEATVFDSVNESFEYTLFIEAPYDDLVSTASRFWNASGISIDANADGISINASSLESILSGGVTFDFPDTAKRGAPIEDNHTFKLYPNARSVQNEPFAHT